MSTPLCTAADPAAVSSTNPADENAYRRGVEFVICSWCGSHVLVDADWRTYVLDERKSCIAGFTCDWDPCQLDFERTIFTARGTLAADCEGPTT